MTYYIEEPGVTYCTIIAVGASAYVCGSLILKGTRCKGRILGGMSARDVVKVSPIVMES